MIVKQKMKPFTHIYEDVIREAHSIDGKPLGHNEVATVGMMYNDYFVKIRTQCSSCQYFSVYVAANKAESKMMCERGMFSARKGVYTPNGRGICENYTMSDHHRELCGKKLKPGKVKTVKYHKWLVSNYELLGKMFEHLPMGRPDFLGYCHFRFEKEFGEDIYGKPIKNND